MEIKKQTKKGEEEKEIVEKEGRSSPN